jgi:DNA-binding transcriptional ArsR family regulator
MKDALLSGAVEISDPRVAAIFSDPLRRRLVLLLAAGQRSLSELANDTGLDLKRLHYHVTTLQDLGLVIVKQKRARAGRAIKVYGTIASAFLVPANLSLSGPDVALMAELRKSLAEVHDRGAAGTLYYLTANGEPRMRPLTKAGARRAAAAEYWRVIKLSRTDLFHLTSAIEDCLKTIPKCKNESNQTYLVHFAIAPRATNR